MEAVLRAVTVYLILSVLFRIFGKRALADVTTHRFGDRLIRPGAGRPPVTHEASAVPGP